MRQSLVFPRMRQARRDTIRTTGIFHKMWRGHNRERVLESDEDKNANEKSLRVGALGALLSDSGVDPIKSARFFPHAPAHQVEAQPASRAHDTDRA